MYICHKKVKQYIAVGKIRSYRRSIYRLTENCKFNAPIIDRLVLFDCSLIFVLLILLLCFKMI